ncbi:putative GntR family transcriptional regulator [Reticulomyxa filosa]|uniref:Putative GntR family transcriptional regulator n=1 Tax=Reticulomyxa filosa TaxID=46433 RepID=X6MB94_RETFI|nr:putative GntR family transcriptional regulator [Reticulomyxa filosa]|eukprot:ETO10911.1 putative GntR family transcriptional regulator [Reticulomyxa filosa]
MHLKSSILAKAMEAHLHEENEDEYHNSLDYGLNEGPWSMRCTLAEWLNGICNTANYGEEKKSTNNEKKEKEKDENKDKAKPRVLTSIPRLTDDVSTDPSAVGYRGVHLFLTAGVSDGLRLCCSTLLHPKKEKDIVLCEDPTYFIKPNIIQSYHGQVLPIETSPKHGLDITYLRMILQNCAKHDMLKRIAFFYVIPFFHNPLGVSLSLEKCQQLIQLAHEYDIWIVSDEIYMALYFPRDDDDNNNNNNNNNDNSYEKNNDHNNDDSNTVHGHTCSLSIIEKLMYPDLDSDKYRVLSLSGVSKIIGPGFRCGWIHTFNEHYLDNVLSSDGVLISSGCLSSFVFSLLQHVWLSDDWSLHLRYVQRQLARNCKLLCAELFKYNTPQLTLLKCYCIPSGGYFLWVELPQGITCDQVESFIQQKHTLVKVSFSHGCSSSSCFSPLASKVLFRNDLIWDWSKYQTIHHLRMKRCVRLCFGYLNESDLQEGAKIFTDSVFALYQENLKLLDFERDKKNGGNSSFH